MGVLRSIARGGMMEELTTHDDMARDISTIIAGLDAFLPEDDDDNDRRLLAILEGLKDLPERKQAMSAIFALMERFPDAQLGSPGPLVNELEAMGDYEIALRASLSRVPADLSVWMVNRLLNGDNVGGPWRQAWLSDLRDVAKRVDVPASVREAAFSFLRFQSDRELP
jgi:hypothetical protein